MRCKVKEMAAKAKCMKWCKSLVEITRNAGIKVREKPRRPWDILLFWLTLVV